MKKMDLHLNKIVREMETSNKKFIRSAAMKLSILNLMV